MIFLFLAAISAIYIVLHPNNKPIKSAKNVEEVKAVNAEQHQKAGGV
jgi:hypothetical protein